MNNKKILLPYSKISIYHFLKMIGRSSIFLFFAVVYINDTFGVTDIIIGNTKLFHIIKNTIWLIFIGEMLLRFFPSDFESKGCQKQFAKSFIPVRENYKPSFPEVGPKHPVAIVATSWILLNAVIFLLYFLGILDAGILFLISMAYGICDMICILFFCPFQQWMMKNKCCGTCRIYNWDFAMMFTPLIVLPNIYNWSLLGFSLALLITWEFLYKFHPERFSEATNEALSCTNCEEKLCRHKKTLQKFLKKHRQLLLKK